ncbi:MAG: hypothetical protein GC160_02150 [Acidobacteria bacterium]|nr:hypothetical protein [Acidobacteriota bacterium]
MRPHSSSSTSMVLALLTLGAAWAAADPLWAQQGFAPKAPGSTFKTDSPFYSDPALSIQFAAPVIPGAQKQPGRYKAYLNGIDLSAGGALPLVPVGPLAPPGGWPQGAGYQYPFRDYFLDRYNLMSPVVADTVDTARGYVIQRNRTLLYDVRPDENIIPASTLAIPHGVGVQLTPEGLEKLEELHLTTLPRRNLEEFNDSFRAELSASGLEDDLDIRLFNGQQVNDDRICFAYSDVAAAFPATYGPVTSLFADATAQYLAYESLDDALGTPGGVLAVAGALAALPPPLNALAALGAQQAVDNACVKQVPVPGDFELCFAKLEADIVDANLYWVNSVDLQLGAQSGQVDADPIELGVVEGSANLLLRDAVLRYKSGRQGCGFPGIFHRPEAELDNQQTFTDATRYNFARCPNVTFRAEGAVNRRPVGINQFEQTPVELLLEIDGTNPEKVTFSQLDPQTYFDLTDEGDMTANTGACALSDPLQDAAEDLLAQFYPVIEAALGSTWDEGSPSRHAQAMDLLFQPFEVGTQEPAKYETRWPFLDTGTDDDLPYSGPPNGVPDVYGIFGLMNAEARPRRQALVVPPTQTFFHQHHGFAQADRPSTALWDSRFDYQGDAYDVAYTFSVNALNQILGAQMSTDRLRFDFIAGEIDLLRLVAPGGPPPAGTPTTGTAWGQFLPQLMTFQNAEIAFRVEPNLAPFLFIHPDPVPLLGQQHPPREGELPMTYSVGDLQVTVAVRSAPGKPWVEAARYAVDIYDPGVQLRFNSEPRSKTLEVIRNVAPSVRFLPLFSKIPGCPIRVPVGHEAPAGDCMSDLNSRVASLLTPQLLDRFYSLLEDIPGPQLWDADGKATVYVQVEHLSNLAWGGSRYTMFGRFGVTQE